MTLTIRVVFDKPQSSAPRPEFSGLKSPTVCMWCLNKSEHKFKVHLEGCILSKADPLKILESYRGVIHEKCIEPMKESLRRKHNVE